MYALPHSHAALDFDPQTVPEGCIRVEAKICELCGRNFFRDAQQTLCNGCTRRPWLMPRQTKLADAEVAGAKRA